MFDIEAEVVYNEHFLSIQGALGNWHIVALMDV